MEAVLDTVRERLNRSPLGRRLAAGTAWSLAGAVAGRFFTLVSAIVVARLLGKEAFGKLGIIQSTLMMFATVASLGLGSAAMIYVARHYKTDPDRAGRVAALTRSVAQITGIVASLGLFAGAPWLAGTTLGAPELSPLLRIVSLSLFFIAANGVQTSILSGLQAFDLNAKSGVITGFGAAVALVVGAWFGGLTGGAWGLLGGYVFTAGITHLFLRHKAQLEGVCLHARGMWRERAILHAVSLPAFLCNVMVVPTGWICNAILVNSAGFGDMGLMNMANQWRALLMFIPGVFASTITPILASLYGEGNASGYRRTVLLNLLINGAVTSVACIGISLASPLVVASYGSDFRGGEWVLVLTCVSGVLVAINGVVGSEMTGRGRIWLGALFCLLVSASLILFAWLLVPRFGALGLAWAYVLAYVLHSLWQGAYLWHSLSPARLDRAMRERECTSVM